MCVLRRCTFYYLHFSTHAVCVQYITVNLHLAIEHLTVFTEFIYLIGTEGRIESLYILSTAAQLHDLNLN